MSVCYCMDLRWYMANFLQFLSHLFSILRFGCQEKERRKINQMRQGGIRRVSINQVIISMVNGCCIYTRA